MDYEVTYNQGKSCSGILSKVGFSRSFADNRGSKMGHLIPI
jgi:hypothetical protein